MKLADIKIQQNELTMAKEYLSEAYTLYSVIYDDYNAKIAIERLRSID